jgi:hypothetical protein
MFARRRPRLIMTLAHDARGREEEKEREGGEAREGEGVERQRGTKGGDRKVKRFNLRSINGAVLSVSA